MSLPPDEWADQNRVLTARMGAAEPGPYRTDRTPYLRTIYQAFARPHVRELTFCKSTQVGGSELVYTLLGYIVDVAPGPTLVVVPRDKDVGDMMTERIKPTFEDSPSLRRHISGWAEDWTVDRLTLDTCRVFVASSQSPAELGARPVRYLFGDETEKWPGVAGKETPPFELARERLRTYAHNSKTVLVSTPHERAGLIMRELERSHLHRYHVPCPSCGAWQVLRFERIHFGSDDIEEIRQHQTARYRCEACEHEIRDRDRIGMLRAGVWVPEGGRIRKDGSVVDPQPEAPHVGFHIWAGYSPWLSWSRIAVEFLRAKDDPMTLKNFVNSWLAEPWEERVQEPTHDLLRACVSKHARDEVPDDVHVITAGVDVQKDQMWYAIWGWGFDSEAWLIRVGRTMDWPELENLLCKGVWGPRKLPVRATCIDSRHRRDEVQAFARRWPESVRLILGVELDSPDYWRTARKLDRHPVTRAPMPGLIESHLNVGPMKDIVAAHIQTAGAAGPKGFHLHAGATDELLRHLESEHKVVVRKPGSAKERWITKHGYRANHWWDATVYAFAAARMIYAHLMTQSSTGEVVQRAAREPSERRGGGWMKGRRGTHGRGERGRRGW